MKVMVQVNSSPAKKEDCEGSMHICRLDDDAVDLDMMALR